MHSWYVWIGMSAATISEPLQVLNGALRPHVFVVSTAYKYLFIVCSFMWPCKVSVAHVSINIIVTILF